MILLIQTLAKVVTKIVIWFMFNCQTKRTIVALFIYPEIPPCWVFLGGPVFEYLFVYTIAQSSTIPTQSPFFTTQFASQNPHNFLFFPHPVRRPDMIMFQNLSIQFPLNYLSSGCL